MIPTNLRTRRLSVKFQELTLGDVIDLCKLSPSFHEQSITEVLNRIVVSDPTPRPGQVTNPRLWTAQERGMAIAHYIAATTDGDRNFQIGDGRYSDYIRSGEDFAPDSIELGELEGDKWFMRPLLGFHAEAIERLTVYGKLEKKRHGWWLGCMACQLYLETDDTLLENLSESELDEFIEARVTVFKNFPERNFLSLLMMFLDGQEKLNHLLKLTCTDEGLAFDPVTESGVEGNKLAPARFPYHACISELALKVFGNIPQPSQ